jgi:hypothetical protein
MFRLLRRHILLYKIVCKTSMLTFPIVLEFFNCSLFRRVLKTHWNSCRLDWTKLGRCEHPVTLETDWAGLDSTRFCWCVRTPRRTYWMTYSCRIESNSTKTNVLVTVRRRFVATVSMKTLSASLHFNLLEPCVLYIGRAYRYPPNVAFYIFFFNKYKYGVS